jgi:CyaY protein
MNSIQIEKIDDKQFHQIASHLLQSIEVSLEKADEILDLDLDIARQGGNVVNIVFRDRSVIVLNTQPLA